MMPNKTQKYIIEYAEKFLCIPSCLNMIFRRRQLPLFPQNILGYQLGLVVPPDQSHLYPEATTSDVESDWGVHPQNHSTSIESMFNRLNIPLFVKYIHISEVPTNSVADVIEENVCAGNDIMVGYDYAKVFNEGKHVGHVGLIVDINTKKNMLSLIDPEDKEPINTSINKMLAGISEKQGGFWIFAKDNKDIVEHFI